MLSRLTHMLATIGAAILLGRDVAVAAARGRFSGREVVRQCYEQANRSLFFLTVTMAFMGAIMIIQACLQAQRLIGDLTTIGPGFLDLVVQLFAPTIGGIMIATRVGAGIAAELGTMQVTEQTDALRLCGTDPISFLVVPRVLAGMVMMPLLAIWAATVAWLVGGVVAHRTFHVATDQYLGYYLVDIHDLGTGLTKALVFGAALTLVAAYNGLRAHGGSSGVGAATTKAVIYGILAILVLDFTIGGVSYLLR